MREKLALRYNTLRPFLSLLGESDALGAAPAGRHIRKAVRRLPALSRRRVKDRPLLPREVDTELVGYDDFLGESFVAEFGRRVARCAVINIDDFGFWHRSWGAVAESHRGVRL